MTTVIEGCTVQHRIAYWSSLCVQYDSTSAGLRDWGGQRVETRSDRIKELPDGTRTISTKFGELRESLWTTVDEQGRLIKQVQNNNVTVTGSTREDLRAIWEPRNLW